jgi:hypothetical protein
MYYLTIKHACPFSAMALENRTTGKTSNALENGSTNFPRPRSYLKAFNARWLE